MLPRIIALRRLGVTSLMDLLEESDIERSCCGYELSAMASNPHIPSDARMLNQINLIGRINLLLFTKSDCLTKRGIELLTHLSTVKREREVQSLPVLRFLPVR